LLALGPGTVVSYERNALTNARLAAAGIEVIEVPGGELAGLRGGPRAICCPVGREATVMPEPATEAAPGDGKQAALTPSGQAANATPAVGKRRGDTQKNVC
ncbi:MAG TPA: arginine deiminase family protein, partial [Trebonia sp.]|nr:arginine deiminase family protein [Trebonia sp.]